MSTTPPNRHDGRRAAAIALAAIALAAAILFVSGVFDAGDRAPQRATTTIDVDTLDPGKVPDKTIAVPVEAIREAEAGVTGEAADDLGAPGVDEAAVDHTSARDEAPPGTPAGELEDNAEELAENRAETDALPTAGASGGFPGCVTAFVRNQSSRRGTRPTVQVLHYTVSPNRPGRSDVNGITAYFNRSSSQASSHFVIDADGNCNYIVPLEAKAWTQGGGNPWAVSYEIIATGREAVYLAAAGYRKLGAVMREVSRRTGIPMRTGRVSGCAPSRSGIVQHADGGTCWGGHHDIGPFPFGAVVRKIRDAANAAGCNRACQRNRRHVATHRELRGRRCAPPARARSERCKHLHRRNAALHAAGVKRL